MILRKAQVPMERGLGDRTPGRAPGLQVGQPAPGCGEPPPGGLASGVSGPVITRATTHGLQPAPARKRALPRTFRRR